MGCHTWFYKKSEDQPTYKYCRSVLLKTYSEDIELYQQHVANTLPNDKFWLFEDYSIESSMHNISVLQRIVRIIENEYCKEATMRRYSQHISNMFYYNGVFYNAVNYHDLFRIGGYPNNILLSLDETLSFIEKNKDIVYGYHNNTVKNKTWLESLQDFWNEYPDGLIKFG